MVYEFGARLLQLRKAKNLTQQALVDRAKALDPDLPVRRGAAHRPACAGQQRRLCT